ncbi:MAG: septum site-determining protein MinC [Rhodospirillales bacterium]|nr:septum site-determining protein MinC [Rhodospirillales bacterium]
MHVVRASEPSPSQPAFRLRGTSLSLVVLELHETAPEAVLPSLERLLSKAPAFLWQAPIILDLASNTPEVGAPEVGAPEVGQTDLARLLPGLRRLKLHPIGVLSGPEGWQTQAAALGLPVMPRGTQRSLPLPSERPQQNQRKGLDLQSQERAAANRTSAEPLETEELSKPTLMIARPVRAGQQIYADGGGDLIVTASVNPGAEIIADGHIHVYGALKGRAIAGARGNREARIFALRLDPELLAIGGYYTMHGDIETAVIGKGVEVSMEDRSFKFRLIGQ